MIKKLQALRAKKGFTLVELVVVIAIIGVLAAILVPTMMGVVQDSRITSANTSAQQIKDRTTEFFTKMDAAKASLQLASASIDNTSKHATLAITVANGKWAFDTTNTDMKVTLTDGTDWLDNKTGSKGHWQTNSATMAEDTNTANPAGIQGKDTALLSYLADSLSDLKNAYIIIYVSANGKVTGVISVDGASAKPGNVVLPSVTSFQKGIDLFKSGATGSETPSAKAGVAGNTVIGTAPALSLGDPTSTTSTT